MAVFVPVRAGALVFVFAALAGATGCGGGKQTGSVSGTVRYKGAPVTAGSINFLSKTGSAAIAKIDATGHFKVDGALETGEYRVYATPPLPEPVAPGTKAPALPKFEVPTKFRDPVASGTTVTVNAGANDIPIEFKD